MLSGPPGMQKAQVCGIDASTKCVCLSPISSGIMKPCTLTSFWSSEATPEANCGT